MAGATSLAGDQLAAIGKRANRLYRMWQPIWTKLAHVREGIGGFLDGTYLIAHPREWLDHTGSDGKPNTSPTKASPKLLRRRALARYENFGGKIIDQMKSALFREEPTRRVGDDVKGGSTPIELWWPNIERKATRSASMPTPNPLSATGGPQAARGAARTSINKLWPQAWDASATFGHMFIALDRPAGPAALTQADQQDPFLRMYTPLDAVDWLTDDMGNLTAIMFLEMVQRQSIDQVEMPALFNVRVFTTDYWALYDQTYTLLEGGPVDGLHKLGRIPVVTLYAKRRNLVPIVGESVMGDPQLYIDLYNLTSEIRELLRNQTFGLLNVQLGPDESVIDAQTNLGQMTGTESVLFSKGKADFISPSAENVKAYQDERADLIRAIYRLSAIAWESDSKDAEAKGSLKLKREDLNQMLSAFADELERAELEVAELFYRATYGAEAWEARFAQDMVVIRYPETFDATPFDVILAQAQAALALGMPPSFTKELKKRLVPKFLPDSPTSLIETINQEIDAGTQELSPMQQLLGARLGAGQPTADGTQPDQKTLDAIAKKSTTDGRMTAVDAAAA